MGIVVTPGCKGERETQLARCVYLVGVGGTGQLAVLKSCRRVGHNVDDRGWHEM